VGYLNLLAVGGGGAFIVENLTNRHLESVSKKELEARQEGKKRVRYPYQFPSNSGATVDAARRVTNQTFGVRTQADRRPRNKRAQAWTSAYARGLSLSRGFSNNPEGPRKFQRLTEKTRWARNMQSRVA
jgi:hypothetical protein